MASEVREFQVQIPAGTLKTAPAVTNLVMPVRQVEKIEWRVPPGPNGLMGWSLTMGGQQVLPFAAGQFIIANDEKDSWEVQGLPNSGAWQLTAYNTGNFPHTVYLRFFVSVPGQSQSAAGATTFPDTAIGNQSPGSGGGGGLGGGGGTPPPPPGGGAGGGGGFVPVPPPIFAPPPPPPFAGGPPGVQIPGGLTVSQPLPGSALPVRAAASEWAGPAAEDRRNEFDVWMIGADGHLYHDWWRPGAGWNGPEIIDGRL